MLESLEVPLQVSYALHLKILLRIPVLEINSHQLLQYPYILQLLLHLSLLLRLLRSLHRGHKSSLLLLLRIISSRTIQFLHITALLNLLILIHLLLLNFFLILLLLVMNYIVKLSKQGIQPLLTGQFIVLRNPLKELHKVTSLLHQLHILLVKLVLRLPDPLSKMCHKEPYSVLIISLGLLKSRNLWLLLLDSFGFYFS